jgi:hypothetical protein
LRLSLVIVTTSVAAKPLIGGMWHEHFATFNANLPNLDAVSQYWTKIVTMAWQVFNAAVNCRACFHAVNSGSCI